MLKKMHNKRATTIGQISNKLKVVSGVVSLKRLLTRTLKTKQSARSDTRTEQAINKQWKEDI